MKYWLAAKKWFRLSNGLISEVDYKKKDYFLCLIYLDVYLLRNLFLIESRTFLEFVVPKSD